MPTDPSDILRGDALARAAGEKTLDAFKYLAGACWAPVVIIVGFFQGGADYGFLLKTLITLSLVGLIVSGTLFFYAYFKQNLAMSHLFLGKTALETSEKTRAGNLEKIRQNLLIAQIFGNLADNIGFPIFVVSYGILAIVSLISVWI
ncbi:MAG: hypothetical protein AAFW46_01010 [Pseudomonadota bacterium]